MSERNLIAFWSCVTCSSVWASSGSVIGLLVAFFWLSCAIFIYIENKGRSDD